MSQDAGQKQIHLNKKRQHRNAKVLTSCRLEMNSQKDSGYSNTMANIIIHVLSNFPSPHVIPCCSVHRRYSTWHPIMVCTLSAPVVVEQHSYLNWLTGSPSRGQGKRNGFHQLFLLEGAFYSCLFLSQVNHQPGFSSQADCQTFFQILARLFPQNEYGNLVGGIVTVSFYNLKTHLQRAQTLILLKKQGLKIDH